MKPNCNRRGRRFARALSMRVFTYFLRNQSGATALEYVLIASGVALAIVVAVNLLGGEVTNLYAEVVDGFDIDMPGSPDGGGPSDTPDNRPRCVQVGSNCKK